MGPFGGGVDGGRRPVGATEIEGVLVAEPGFEALALPIIEGGRKHECLADIPLDRSAPRHRLPEEGADVGAVAEVGNAIAPFKFARGGAEFAAVDEQPGRRADRARLLDADDQGRPAEGRLERAIAGRGIVHPAAGEAEGMLLGAVDLEDGREGATGIGAGIGGVADAQDSFVGRPGFVGAKIDDNGECQARVAGHWDGERGRGGVAGGGGEPDSRAARERAFAHKTPGKPLAVGADPLGGARIAAVAARIGPDRHRGAIVVREAIGPQPELEGDGKPWAVGRDRLDSGLAWRLRRGRAVWAVWPWSASGYPGNEGLDLRLGEPAVGGHLEAVGVVHRPDEEAFEGGLPRIDRWARVAPADQARARVKPQSPLRLVARMTGMAALDEEGADDSLEVIIGRVGRARRRGEEHGGHCGGHDGGHAWHSRTDAERIAASIGAWSHRQPPPRRKR